MTSELLPGIERVLFLGDSITYAGLYVTDVELFLRRRFPERRWEILGLGLPSETVSGLTEPGHAGGAFPRPCVFERLDRTLAKVQPQAVVACYGMNCGIYHPLDEGRFRAFRDGVERLHARVEASGAAAFHVTPPVFDSQPIAARCAPAGKAVYPSDTPFVGYDDVLARYSQWLVGKRRAGWKVGDCHGAMRRALTARRKSQPEFTFAGDGVHCDAAGHRLIAAAALEALGVRRPRVDESAGPLWEKLDGRRRLLGDAYLSAIGHTRPGMAAGMALPAALVEASRIERELAAAPR